MPSESRGRSASRSGRTRERTSSSHGHSKSKTKSRSRSKMSSSSKSRETEKYRCPHLRHPSWLVVIGSLLVVGAVCIALGLAGDFTILSNTFDDPPGSYIVGIMIPVGVFFWFTDPIMQNAFFHSIFSRIALGWAFLALVGLIGVVAVPLNEDDTLHDVFAAIAFGGASLYTLTSIVADFLHKAADKWWRLVFGILVPACAITFLVLDSANDNVQAAFEFGILVFLFAFVMTRAIYLLWRDPTLEMPQFCVLRSHRGVPRLSTSAESTSASSSSEGAHAPHRDREHRHHRHKHRHRRQEITGTGDGGVHVSRAARAVNADTRV